MFLDNGTTPKIFGWREALLAHIEHERVVRTKAHEFDLRAIEKRLNIIEGFLIAIANIDEVVSIIRNSNDKKSAKIKLIQRFNFNEEQVEAVLKLTLSKLINLEVQSFKNEKDKLLIDRDYHKNVLTNIELLNKEIEKDMLEVINKYGDKRRTRIINLDFSDEENEEPIEKKELIIYYTNLGNIYTVESSTLMRTRRGGKGSKVKLGNNEVISKVIRDDNFSSLLVFSNQGKMYHINTDDLPINAKVNIAQLCDFSSNEKPTALTTIQKNENTKYYVFITKQGMIKKTKAEEYILKRGKSLKAINLKDNDEIVNVIPISNENIGILTNNGNFIRIDTEEITPIGRATAGVKGIKLADNDYVISAHTISAKDKFIVSLSEKGLIKKTDISEFPMCGRATKGKKISEVRDGDKIIEYLSLDTDCDIIIIVKKKSIKISTSELKTLSRNATGVKGINIDEGDVAVSMQVETDE